MIKNKIVLALISILTGLFLSGMLAAIALPIVEEATKSLAEATQTTITLALLVPLLVTLIAFPLLVYRWSVKRAAEAEPELPEDQRKPILAFIGLAIICAGILFYTTILSTNRISDMAFLFGQNLVIGLFFYIVFALLAGKHLSATQKSVSYLLILGSLMFGGYTGAQKQLLAENESLARMQENMQRIFDTNADGDGRLAPIETDSATAQSQGANSIAESWLNTYLNEVIANQNNYLTELEAVNYFDLLDGDRVRADPDLAEGRFILKRTREIIDKYEQLGYDTVYAARARIQELKLSDADKGAMEGGLNSSLQRGLDSAEKVWSLERQMLTEAEKILVFLNTIEANWEWEDDQYNFYNTKSLNIFNAYMAEFQKAVDEQTQIQAASSKNIDNIFQKNAN